MSEHTTQEAMLTLHDQLAAEWRYHKWELHNALSRWQDNFWMAIAWSLPHRLVMWATIRLFAHATQGKYGNTVVPELKAMDALERWDQ